MQRADSFAKTLMLGKIEGRRKRGWQRIRWLDGSPTQWTWVWVNSESWWWTGTPSVLWFMESQRVRQNWVTELNWTEELEIKPLWKLLRETQASRPGKTNNKPATHQRQNISLGSKRKSPVSVEMVIEGGTFSKWKIRPFRALSQGLWPSWIIDIWYHQVKLT